MSCLYRKSKYYVNATLNPEDIIPPMGYHHKKEEEKMKSLKLPHQKKYNQIITKFVPQSTLLKQISGKYYSFKDVQKNLNLHKSFQRKNYCINGVNLDYASSVDPTSIQLLQQSYTADEKDADKLLPFLEILSVLNTFKEFLFQLKNYAISTFMVYYEGSNEKFFNYFQKYLNQYLIEYDSQFLINSPQLQRPQLQKIDYSKKQNVEEYINQIMHIGSYKDKFFKGIHLYICDTLPQLSRKGYILQEEAQYWNYLHAQIAIVMGTLEEGHHAAIKIGGTFNYRTIEYIFLLKLAFSRVIFSKWIGSNPFTNEKFVVCQNFNKENGRYISKYLLDNFDEILREKQKVNIVQFKSLFLNDFQSNINDFNNSTPIIKMTKDKIKLIEGDDKIIFFPNRQKLISKVQKFYFCLENMEEIKKEIEIMIPNSESEKIDRVSIITEQKQAVVFNFQEMAQLYNNNNAKEKKKDKDKGLFDLEQNFKEHDISGIRLVKEDKKKKKKKQRTEE